MAQASLAYLILAHADASQLRRLVLALNHKAAFFYIHIDLKSDIRPFHDALRHFTNVCFVERTDVRWLAFSMVEATLTLLRASHPNRHTYYTLLSGSDYPLKSNAEILSFFSDTDREQLFSWRLSDMPNWQHKVQYYYPLEMISSRDYQKHIHRRLFWGTFIKLRGFFPKRNFPVGLDPYGGPQWWSLTHECVQYVLEFIDRRPDVYRFYKTTHSPDEGFFQTIIMNSQFAKRTAGYEEHCQWSASAPNAPGKLRKAGPDPDWYPPNSFWIRYVHWIEAESPGSPGTLEKRHLQMLVDSKKLFGRKFNSIKSATLLDLIDEHRSKRDSIVALSSPGAVALAIETIDDRRHGIIAW